MSVYTKAQLINTLEHTRLCFIFLEPADKHGIMFTEVQRAVCIVMM